MVNTFSKTRQKQNKPHTRSRNIQTVYSVVIYILSNVHVLLDQLFQFVSSWTWLKTCRSERKRERHTQMEGWGEAADKLQSVCRTVVKVPTGFFSSGCFCRDLQVQVRHTHTPHERRSGAADGLKMKMMKSSRIAGVTPLVVLFLLHATRAGTFTYFFSSSEISLIWKMKVIVLNARDSYL